MLTQSYLTIDSFNSVSTPHQLVIYRKLKMKTATLCLVSTDLMFDLIESKSNECFYMNLEVCDEDRSP
jgi:hypothetical protein